MMNHLYGLRRPMLAALMLCITLTARATELHVAPDGNDQATGSADAPLATLEAARDRVRAQRKARQISDAVTIIVHGGLYRCMTSFELKREDGGTEAAPVTYRAANNEKPVFCGGVVLVGFEPVTDEAVTSRLDPAAREHVRVVDLAKFGVKDFGAIGATGFGRGATMWPELFFDGQVMTLARYPNAGWLGAVKGSGGEPGDQFTYPGDRPARWKAEPDAWVYGYWRHDWADQYLPIKSIDTEAKTIITGVSHDYGMKTGARFIGYNLLCELDAPGEWYLDRGTGKLYFWPPKGSGEVMLSVMDGPMISMRGASHVTIEGLTIEATRGSGIIVRDGENVAVHRCTVRNVGDVGVAIEGGRNDRVEACEIGGVGGTGLILSGGNRKTLESGGHVAIGNHIHDFGRVQRTYRPGIAMHGVGLRVANNLIHDGPHAGILYGGNDQVIEFNEIHHVVLDSDDAGAIYTGRDWTARGHVIRYNYLHDCGPTAAPAVEIPDEPGILKGTGRSFGASLIYHDDTAPGITVEGNILAGGDRGMLIGGGRDNITRNNIFIGCRTGIWIDARGRGWASEYIKPGGGWGMYEKLDAMRITEPPYSERYPTLATIKDHDPASPLGNVIEHNVFVNVKDWLTLHGVKEEEVAIADNAPEIEMAETAGRTPMDMAVKLDPAMLERLHFEAIPFDRIGLPREP
ncbi:MAG: hypothetical protein GC162_09380 [Planctomycetes bacterium]|nr:hypothetical protein [Planctomycetota bacterium]